MDHHDHDHDHSHPSSSIHNAAYPDSNYMPSTPSLADDVKLSSSSPSAASASATYPGPAGSSQSSFPHFQNTVPHSPLEHHSPFQPVAPWTPDPLGVMTPNVPPPPYDPARPATAASSQGMRSAPPSPSPSDSHALLARHPLEPERPRTAYSARPHLDVETGAGGYRMDTLALPGQQSAVSSLDKGGEGPLAAARRRRKRKLGICAGVLCLILLFLVALIVGIAIGVLKLHNKGDDGKRLPGP